MGEKVTPIPEDFHTITPHLCVKNVSRAIEYYQDIFGAEELYRNTLPDGKTIIHSEMLLGDSRFFLHDEFPEHNVLSPETLKGSGLTLHLYVENVDDYYEKARNAGCEVLFELDDTFWGDRYCKLKDPFGHLWSIASRIEDLSPAETNKRAEEFFSKGSFSKE